MQDHYSPPKADIRAKSTYYLHAGETFYRIFSIVLILLYVAGNIVIITNGRFPMNLTGIFMTCLMIIFCCVLVALFSRSIKLQQIAFTLMILYLFIILAHATWLVVGLGKAFNMRIILANSLYVFHSSFGMWIFHKRIKSLTLLQQSSQ